MCSDDNCLLPNAWFLRKSRRNQLFKMSFFHWKIHVPVFKQKCVKLYHTATLTEPCLVTSFSKSEYFSGFCLFSHNIFKKWLRIFSAFQVCDCAATLKIAFATSVQVITISLVLFFKKSLHSYWKKVMNPLKRAVFFALLFENIPQGATCLLTNNDRGLMHIKSYCWLSED